MSTQDQAPAVTCNESPLLALLSLDSQLCFYFNVLEAKWGSDRIAISVIAEDSAEESFLDGTRSQRGAYILAYRRNVALGDLVSNEHVFKNQQRTWALQFLVKRTDFIPSLEVGFSGTSADKLAELRARRILLNENPAVESSDINDVTRELFIGGFETIMRVKGSPFPGLFAQYGQDARRYLEVAWIQAAMSLKLGGCVAQIVQLELTLQGTGLDVVFRGLRKGVYVNQGPYEIVIRGTCSL